MPNKHAETGASGEMHLTMSADLPESVGSREKSARNPRGEGVASWHPRRFTLSRIYKKASHLLGAELLDDEQRHVCGKRRTWRSWSLCIETLRAFYRGTCVAPCPRRSCPLPVTPSFALCPLHPHRKAT